MAAGFLPAVSEAALKSSPDLCGRVAADPKAAVVTVNERLELVLSDGRTLRLAGLEAPGATPTDPDLSVQSRVWLEARVRGRDVALRILDAKPDRWGRWPALVFESTAETVAPSLGEALIADGLARPVPDQTRTSCEARFRAAARRAQAVSAGLWKDPYYGAIAPDDKAAFAEHSGSFVEAQGRLSEVKSTSGRLILVFGVPRRGHLVVTVLQRNVKNFETAGLHFRELIGQTLRVRGLLETRFGPEIEITRVNDVEVVPPEPGTSSSRPTEAEQP